MVLWGKLSYKLEFIHPCCLLLLLLLLLQCASPCAGAESQNEDNAGCEPEHVHLSYGSNSLEMVVLWETQRSCPHPKVEYGIGSFNLDLTAQAETQDLTGCGGENCSLTFVHKAVLKGLSPSSTVFYLPISGGVRAGPFYFHMPGQDQQKPLEFLLTSLSPPGGSQDLVVKSLDKAIFLHSYSGTFLLDKPNRLICKNRENIFPKIERLATHVPLMVGADSEPEDDNQECVADLFPRPSQSAKSKSGDRKRWYSLDVGIIHFIVYSSRVFLEKDPKQGKAMQTWMIDDLTKANKKRSVTPWVIAVGSDPMYCQPGASTVTTESPESVRDCARNDSLIRHGLEDLFYHFAVDLVLEFQRGVYQRTWPHYKRVKTSESYSQPGSPVEIILAHGVLPDATGNDTVRVVDVDWTARRLTSTGNSYGQLSVSNASHLHFQWRQSTADSDGSDDKVLDEFWLVQERHGNFSLSSLPHNVSHKINQSIIAMGGKPGTYDFISTMTPGPQQEGEGWSKYSLWFGLGLVAVAIIVGLGVATIRSYVRRRRSKAGRRWREVDRHQGGDGGSGHFYSMASDSDTDENDHDFEIDMFERTAKSESKLLTSY